MKKLSEKINIHNSCWSRCWRFKILPHQSFLIKWLKIVEITENLRWAKTYFIKIAESVNWDILEVFWVVPRFSRRANYHCCKAINERDPNFNHFSAASRFLKVRQFISTENHFCDILFALLSISSFMILKCVAWEFFNGFLIQWWAVILKILILSNILDLTWCLPSKWKIPLATVRHVWLPWRQRWQA